MTFSEQLLHHAVELMADAGAKPEVEEARNRRAVSACYYALFHRLTEDSAELLGPHMPLELRSRIARWFDHSEIKRICGHFTKPSLEHRHSGERGVALNRSHIRSERVHAFIPALEKLGTGTLRTDDGYPCCSTGLRAMLAGTIANLMSASIVSMLLR